MVHCPNESAEYRAARDDLLRGEAELRQRTEDVAAERRALPLGGLVKEDYTFETMDEDPSASHSSGSMRSRSSRSRAIRHSPPSRTYSSW